MRWYNFPLFHRQYLEETVEGPLIIENYKICIFASGRMTFTDYPHGWLMKFPPFLRVLLRGGGQMSTGNGKVSFLNFNFEYVWETMVKRRILIEIFTLSIPKAFSHLLTSSGHLFHPRELLQFPVWRPPSGNLKWNFKEIFCYHCSLNAVSWYIVPWIISIGSDKDLQVFRMRS